MRRPDNDTILIGSEVAIFLSVIFVLSLDEYFDVPFLFFGDAPSPCGVAGFTIEAALIGILGLVSLWITIALLRRARRAESFLRVCGWCKKISIDDKWIPFEEYIAEAYHRQSSHGICGDCKQKMLEEAQRGHDQ